MPRADQHDEIELNYLTSGSLTYLVGGRHAVVPAQHLATFGATAPHQIVEYTGNEPYYVATIPFAWYLKWGITTQLHDRLLQWEMELDAASCEPAREQLMFEQWLHDVHDAEDSGFDSLSCFNRAFKQFTGVTPREYRKNLR